MSRSEKIEIRVSPDEKAALERMAAAKGITVSELVRQIAKAGPAPQVVQADAAAPQRQDRTVRPARIELGPLGSDPKVKPRPPIPGWHGE